MDTKLASDREPCRARLLIRRPVAGLGLVLALTSVLAAATGSPARAEPVLVVSPAAGLDPAGAFVVVSGSGYLPNSQLFVMQCRASSGDDHTCNSVGLRKVTTDAAGSFTANAMRLVGRFGATDCAVAGCAVMTSAVSDHADDRSQDRTAAIEFAAPVPTTQSPPPETVPATAPPTVPTTASSTPDPTSAPASSSGVTTVPAHPPTTTTPSAVASATSTTATGERGAGTAADTADDGAGGGAEVDARALAATSLTRPGDDDGGSGALVAVGVGAAVAAVAAAGVVSVRRRRLAEPPV